MARPRQNGPRTNTAIRFPGDLHARLENEAERRDVSLNQLVVWAVERTLPGWEQQDLDALIGARAVLRGEP
jgi:hypothetical protein